jgi:hypothetical protein
MGATRKGGILGMMQERTKYTYVCRTLMEAQYSQYEPHLIQTILQEYKKGVRGHGFQALANKYEIKGGARLVRYWHSKWDGTESSLLKQSGGDTRSILTPREEKIHIYNFVNRKSKVEAVTYPEVQENVELKTGKEIALSTVKTHGKSLKISSKKRKRIPKDQGLFISCPSISLYFRARGPHSYVLCDRDQRIR